MYMRGEDRQELGWAGTIPFGKKKTFAILTLVEGKEGGTKIAGKTFSGYYGGLR